MIREALCLLCGESAFYSAQLRWGIRSYSCDRCGDFRISHFAIGRLEELPQEKAALRDVAIAHRSTAWIPEVGVDGTGHITVEIMRRGARRRARRKEETGPHNAGP